jgi:hypothetical protein
MRVARELTENGQVPGSGGRPVREDKPPSPNQLSDMGDDKMPLARVELTPELRRDIGPGADPGQATRSHLAIELGPGTRRRLVDSKADDILKGFHTAIFATSPAPAPLVFAARG